MTGDILDNYPRTKAFLSEEEADNVSDNHMLYAVIDRLLERIENLEKARR